MQLARNREHGGLKLQLPALKSKSLAVNRHLREIDSIPHYRSLLLQDNPRPTISIDNPDIKTILTTISQIPLQIQQNPSVDLIHQYFIRQTELPKVEQNNPTTDWPRTWRNIACKQLTSVDKSYLYLAVNGKIPHNKLLFVMQRAETAECVHCEDHAEESINHKFCSCDRVGPAWELLQREITNILRGWRRLSFDDLIIPTLERIYQRKRVKIMKMFVNYLYYINAHSNDRIINLQGLEFHLKL